MRGLIKKDFLMIKSNIKILVLLFIVYGFLSFNEEMDLLFLLPFMSIMIMISTFSYDAYNKWDAYVITMPDGRKNSVKSKYLATVILLVISTLIVSILAVILAYSKSKSINLENILSTFLGSFFAMILLQSFMYPAIYKFGLEKARIGIFVIVFGITIFLSMISKVINFGLIVKLLDNIDGYLLIILPIIMALMLYISYKISERIYLKKEF